MKTITKVYTVTDDMTAAKYASGTLPVFGTPGLVACMEDTAKTLVEEFLNEGESSVGTKVSTSHVKASKVGAEITVEATLVKQEGRMYDFVIKAFENGVLIGEGEHTRAVINIERFMAKLDK
jgi:predicted thioesterase